MGRRCSHAVVGGAALGTDTSYSLEPILYVPVGPARHSRNCALSARPQGAMGSRWVLIAESHLDRAPKWKSGVSKGERAPATIFHKLVQLSILRIQRRARARR